MMAFKFLASLIRATISRGSVKFPFSFSFDAIKEKNVKRAKKKDDLLILLKSD